MTGRPATFPPLAKSKEQWKALLEPARYAVLFEEEHGAAGLEPARQREARGTFVCAACFLPLFASAAKFDSGTGWPSFFQPIEAHRDARRDFKLLLPRTEYHCARCGGHQGHVFDDGPPPTGLALLQQRRRAALRAA